MDADRTNERNLADGPGLDASPAWSPDGGRIAFSSERYGNWELYAMDADGSGLTRPIDNPEEDSFPAWRP